MRGIRVPGGRRAAILVTATGLLLGLGGCYYHHPGAYGYGGGPAYGHGGYGYHDGHGWDRRRGHGYGYGGGRGRGHRYGSPYRGH